ARVDSRVPMPTRSPTAAADTGRPSPTTHRTASSTTATGTSRARSRRGQPPPRYATPSADPHRSPPSSSPSCVTCRGGTATGSPDDNSAFASYEHTADRTPAARLLVQQPDTRSAGTYRAAPPASRTLRASPSRPPDSLIRHVQDALARLGCVLAGGVRIHETGPLRSDEPGG